MSLLDDIRTMSGSFMDHYNAFVKRRAERIAAGDIPKVFSYDEYRNERAAAQAAYDAGDRGYASATWSEGADWLVVAACPKTGIVMQGRDIDGALASLNDARVLVAKYKAEH